MTEQEIAAANETRERINAIIDSEDFRPVIRKSRTSFGVRIMPWFAVVLAWCAVLFAYSAHIEWMAGRLSDAFVWQCQFNALLCAMMAYTSILHYMSQGLAESAYCAVLIAFRNYVETHIRSSR